MLVVKDLCLLIIKDLVMSISKITFIAFHLFTNTIFFKKQKSIKKIVYKFNIPNYFIYMYMYNQDHSYSMCMYTHTLFYDFFQYHIFEHFLLSLHHLTKHDDCGISLKISVLHLMDIPLFIHPSFFAQLVLTFSSFINNTVINVGVHTFLGKYNL